MAFCERCGSKLNDGEKFCPNCGAETWLNSNTTSTDNFANPISDGVDNNGFDKKDIQNNKLMAILAYCGVLILIPSFAAKDSKFARFHTNQGLVFLFTGTIATFACKFIRALPGMRLVANFLTNFVSLVAFVFWIIGIVNASKGEYKELPVIGKIQILK